MPHLRVAVYDGISKLDTRVDPTPCRTVCPPTIVQPCSLPRSWPLVGEGVTRIFDHAI
jgi:hypothetical protein